MSVGRTATKWTRVYMDGYDLSGYSRSIGPLTTEFDPADLTCLADAVKGYLPGQSSLNAGALNGVLDPTASTGLHAVFSAGAGVKRIVMAAIGFRAAPAQGDPMFVAECVQKDYTAADDAGAVTVSIPLETYASDATTLLYPRGWGWVLHAKGAETGANTASGIDDTIAGASTTAGGYLVYHAFTADGTATLSVDDSANNSAFSALSGATSGSIDASVTPKFGIVALSPTATVRRYLRWQVTLGTATTITFFLGFVRG